MMEKGLQAGHLGLMSFVYDFDAEQKLWQGRNYSNEIKLILDRNARPVENLEAPMPRAVEVPALGTGDTHARGSAPLPPTFDGPVSLQDETPPNTTANPIDLTEGAPKL